MSSYIGATKQIIAVFAAFATTVTVSITDASAAKKQTTPKPNPQKIANELAQKAKESQNKGDLEQSAKLYAQAFSVRYRSFGHRDPQTIVIATKLGELYRLQKNYEKSEQMLLWAMKALVKSHGFYSDKQIPVLHEYVKFYTETKKFEKAIEKQKIIVSMMEKKDDSNPAIYPEKVKLAEILAKNADYEAADYQLKDADILAEDYEYKPSKESMEQVATVKKYISEKPFKKVVKIAQTKPKVVAKPKVEKGKKLVALPKVNFDEDSKKAPTKKNTTVAAQKVKPASFASTGYNITPTSLDKLDEKVVANGPLEKKRTLLLQFIIKSQRYGIGVRNYVNAFDQIEAMVKAGEPEMVIKKRVDSLTSSLQDQFQRRYVLSHRVPAKKKVRRPGEVGLVPNFNQKHVNRPIARGNQIEDKYFGTPLTEGYLKQIEREVVQEEMKRMPRRKYMRDANGYYRNVARKAKRRRINKYRNIEKGMDYR